MSSSKRQRRKAEGSRLPPKGASPGPPPRQPNSPTNPAKPVLKPLSPAQPSLGSRLGASQTTPSFRFKFPPRTWMLPAGGAIGGVATYFGLRVARVAVFQGLQSIDWLQRFLAGQKPAFVEICSQIVNDAVAFVLFGSFVFGAIVWGAALSQNLWSPRWNRILSTVGLGGVVGGGAIVIIQLLRFSLLPHLPASTERLVAVGGSWALIGPAFGWVLAKGLQQVPLYQALVACSFGGVITGLMWIGLIQLQLDSAGIVRFPLSGAIFGVTLVFVRLYFATKNRRRSTAAFGSAGRSRGA